MAQSAHVDDHGMLEDSHSGLGGPGIFEKSLYMMYTTEAV